MGYILPSIVCSEPLVESEPQCQWSCRKLNLDKNINEVKNYHKIPQDLGIAKMLEKIVQTNKVLHGMGGRYFQAQ